MAHLPDFKHDVFISYPRENKEWVREFRSHLEKALNQLTPSNQKPRIFFDDHDFQGGQHSSTMLEAARHSALFLAIVSPAYVAADKFTLKELEAFCNARRAHRSDDPRVFSIDFLPIKDNHRPAQLKTPKRYQFYWINENNAEVPVTVGEASKDKIYTVAKHITNRLDELKSSDGTGVSKPNLPYSGKTVLLSQVTDDLVGTREEVRDHLEGLGTTVLPRGGYPEWGPEFRTCFEEQLAQSDLFIQLLSEVRSEKWREEADSCAQFQHNTAEAVRKPAMQWRSDNVNISKIQKHHDTSLLEGAQAMGLEQLKKAIQEKLDELTDESKPQPPSTGPPFVYITASDEDLESAQALKKIAVDCKGAARIMEDENPDKDLKEQIRYAAAVIFLYGKARRRFVDDWLAKYYRLARKQRKKRIETIYLAPPSKSEPADQLKTDWNGLRKCGSQQSFSPGCMYNILAELNGDDARCPECRTKS